ncbi:MAG TPA: O-antigen ligase family protein [Gemmatimonadales bacterium]|nr:O-antigen ligase family protein [Gemmatimonadales bacterium]
MGTVAATHRPALRPLPATALAASPSAVIGLRFVIVELVVLGSALVIGLRGALLLLTGAAFLGAILGLWNPRVGLLSVTILCAIEPLLQSFMLNSGLLRWNTLNYWLLMVSLLSVPFLLRQRGLPLRLLQATLLLLAFELFMSQDRARGLQDMLGMAAMLGLLAYFGRGRLTRADWLWCGIVCGVLTAAGGAIYLLQRDSLPHINPNAWAGFPLTGLVALAFAAPFAAHWRGSSTLVSLLATVTAAWIFLSGSRGNMLMAAVTVAYLLVSLRGLSRRAVLVGLAGLTMMVAAVAFPALQARALKRVSVFFDPSATMRDKTSHRSELALAGWYIAQDHPLGVGTGGFTHAWEHLGRRPGLASVDAYRRMSAHAGWIKILVENGMPGALLLAAFVTSFAVTGWRRRRRSALRIGLWASMTLGFAFISTEYQTKAVWFLAAGAIAMLHPRGPLLSPRRHG